MSDEKFDLEALLARLDAMPPEERERVREEARISLRAYLEEALADPWLDGPSEEEVVRLVKKARAEIRAESAVAASRRG